MKVLIVPQYSMRSYQTGKYSLLADGNLNIVLHHLFNECKTNSFDIMVPTNHVEADMDILVRDILPLFKCTIRFKLLDYGLNAEANRTIVPEAMANYYYNGYNKVISYFENLRPTIPWVLKMHMSKIKELDRPYADKYYDDFIGALRVENLIQADVLNYAQYEQVKRDWPNLANCINVHEQCMNTNFYNEISNLFVDLEVVDKLDELMPKGCYFFPFRVSDKAYEFKRVLNTGLTVAVTDPNDSVPDSEYIIKLSEIDTDLKTLLISAIHLIKYKRKDISIPLFEDCELAVHQLIIELCYMIPSQVMFANPYEIKRRYTFQ